MPYLFDPPTKATLPLSKGGDLIVSFINKVGQVDENGPVLDDNGDQVFVEEDYPEGSTVTLVIETTPEITIEADIVGATATCWEQSTIVDPIKPGKGWRCVVSYADGLDKVILNGTVVRKDGK